MTRRIRDLLRAEIIGDSFRDCALPSEEELRVEFGAPRACVRDALAMLQEEGLVNRVRGQGTFVTSGRVHQSLHELHGTEDPGEESIWNGRMSARVLDWSDVAAAPPVALLLRIEPGTPVLRIDYVAAFDGRPIGYATNYVTYPEAARLRRDIMRVDFYALLRHGNIDVGESDVLLDSAVADEHDAELLGIEVGEPVLVGQQTIFDDAGRPIDCAFFRAGGRRSTYFSKATRSSAELGES
jgi:GntR family transcriptional regulator